MTTLRFALEECATIRVAMDNGNYELVGTAPSGENFYVEEFDMKGNFITGQPVWDIE